MTRNGWNVEEIGLATKCMLASVFTTEQRTHALCRQTVSIYGVRLESRVFNAFRRALNRAIQTEHIVCLPLSVFAMNKQFACTTIYSNMSSCKLMYITDHRYIHTLQIRTVQQKVQLQMIVIWISSVSVLPNTWTNVYDKLVIQTFSALKNSIYHRCGHWMP